MDLTVDEFIDGLLSDEAHEKPSDSVKVEDLEMKLPKWFDEKKYNQGRRFFQDFYFMISMSLIPGLVAVFSVPSILKVLIGSRRSCSAYTSYRRYFSTFKHVFTWFGEELKPGSKSWKSIYAVRARHIHAGRAAKLKGHGIVSQRDMALTLFSFIGFVILKPNRFSVTQLVDGDWEGLNHVVRVFGHMLGLEDRYNICRGTAEETREVCKRIIERVYTPCLNNVPEHFEHMTRVMVQGMTSAMPTLESHTLIYLTKHLADVPGYVINEEERHVLQQKIKRYLKESSASDVDEFIDGLLSDEAHEKPSDSVKVKDLEMKLPKWFDEKKYNQGLRFFQDFYFMISISLIPGLVAVFSVPSILKVLTGSRRSSSAYTAYRRYLSTFMHIFTWFGEELKPGSKSWKSMYAVRTRHIHAGRAAKLKGHGIVSQRDVALTLFGFIGFLILKPDRFSVTQLVDGDWEGLNHVVRVFGHMLGLEDRYNICRGTVEETRQVCQKILERVYTPCLNNVPEHFEHMTRVMVQGMTAALPPLESHTLIFLTKHLADVPGYVINEEERRVLQQKIKKHLKESSVSDGVESSALIQKSAVDGLPKNTRRILYLNDYKSLDSAPAYKNLPSIAKWKLAFVNMILTVYTTRVGRFYFNCYLKILLFIATYIPYIAVWRFGIKNAFVNMFVEGPADDMEPKPNSEFYKPLPPVPWYTVAWEIIW